MAFLDLVAELTGTLPGLSPLLAEKYVNRALEHIYGERDWSFLNTDGVLVVPAAITAGAVAITQYATTVTLNATASAAVASQLGVSAVPGIRNLQIRFGSQPVTGGIYSITAYDDSVPAAVVLTLDRAVVEETAAAAAYQIYRPLIVPPVTDFLAWTSLVDPTNAISITREQLSIPVDRIDQRDPQRTASGLSYYLASWGANRVNDPLTGATVPFSQSLQSTPVYELWPGPTSGQVFYVRFRRKGVALVNPDDQQPDLIPDGLIIQRALGWYAYPFAQANVANFPSFKGANWTALILNVKADYLRDLQQVRISDDSRQLSSVLDRGHGLRTGRWFGRGEPGYPIDSNFLQSHLVRF